MEPVFEEVNNDIQAVKFYRIDVDKHIMLSRAYNDKILPKAVLVKNGADSLILRGDVSHQEIRKGLQAILDSSVWEACSRLLNAIKPVTKGINLGDIARGSPSSNSPRGWFAGTGKLRRAIHWGLKRIDGGIIQFLLQPLCVLLLRFRYTWSYSWPSECIVWGHVSFYDGNGSLDLVSFCAIHRPRLYPSAKEVYAGGLVLYRGWFWKASWL